jgi:Domain of unknown function (DUF4387)
MSEASDAMVTVPLSSLAATVRSSNASGTYFTFDVMFDDPMVFERLRSWGGIDARLVGDLYRLPADGVRVFWYEPALTLKITLPRPILTGQPADTDVDGKQQHAPLLDIAVPMALDSPQTTINRRNDR